MPHICGIVKAHMKFKSKGRRDNVMFICFALPAILGFLVFTVYPLIKSFILSFTDAMLIPDPDFPAKFIGLENYIKIFTIDMKLMFGPSLLNTFIYTALSVPLGMLISLGMAVLLVKQNKASGFFRVAFYLPSLLPAVAMSLMFRWLFLPGPEGFLNNFLGTIGIESDIKWLGPGSGMLGLFTIVFMSIWGFGGRMIIFLAALQGVPNDLYEAARIDGAGKAEIFIRITLPMISPIFFYNLVMATIGALQAMTESLIVGGGTQETTFIVYYIYKTAYLGANPSISYASAMSWVLFLVILLFTGSYFIFSKGKVYYDE